MPGREEPRPELPNIANHRRPACQSGGAPVYLYIKQSKGGAAVARFLNQRRFSLALLAAGLAALGLFWALRGHTAAMVWWVDTVSMPAKRVLSALVDPLPFSGCELGAVLLIFGVLAGLGRRVWRKAHGRSGGFGGWAVHTAALVLWIYVLVCALWGTQYYIPGFAARAGIETKPIAAADLAAVTRYFAQNANACAGAVPRDAAGVFAVPAREILTDSEGLYDGLAAEYPFLAGPERRAKPALFSKLMSAWGFTGYLCPLLGESTLNVDCPAVFLPVTVCHEFAHQRGAAAEQEANFVGIRAAVESGRAVYKYSGWLFGFLHLYNALYGADPEAAREIYATLCPAARADMAANNAYWAKWEGPVRETGERVYDAMLQSYDQLLGMRSYGACVDLLVAWYGPICNVAQ